jgi:serine protease
MKSLHPVLPASLLKAAALVALLLVVSPAHAGPSEAAHARYSLAGLEAAKQFDRFIVKYRAGSPEATDAGALQQSLDRVSTHVHLSLQDDSRSRARPATWSLRRLRRMSLGADVVTATQKLGRREAAMLIRQLATEPNVDYVELDRVLHAVLTPNDTNFVNQWGMTDADAGIRADQAWDLGNGSGVVVAVIDTGITDHSDLNANVLPGYDFVSDPTLSNDGDGRDSDAHDPGDYTANSNSSWHGTHVAGTVAAVGNNAKGVIGAAYGAKIVPVRVLGAGGGDLSDIADGLVWAAGGSVPGVPANANPAEVANLSLGGSGPCSITAQNAINTAVSLGTTVVVAAGNDGTDAASFNLANCANVIAVGAVGSSSSRPSFSNYGSTVDVSAPGLSIISTINLGTTVPAGEGYTYYSGTSMATPHTSGTIALAQSARVAHGLLPYTPAAMKAQLKATAYPMVQGCTGLNGAGLVDANALLQTAIGNAQLLTDGVAANNLSASTGTSLYFALPASATRSGLSFTSSGGTGDADLYVKYGSLPTTSSFDCSSNLLGNGESCSIPTAQPGTYYAMLVANSGFSGVSLTGAGTGNAKPVVNFSQSISGLAINVADLSTDSDGSIASRKWTFGDGARATTASASHTYNQAGTYTVQLSDTDNSNATDCTLRGVSVSPPVQMLSNGVPTASLSANPGGELRFTLAVPADATGLQFVTSGGTGDADLYVKYGAPPTLSDYDCSSTSPTTNESCAIPVVQGGTYYVLVEAYAFISNVTLTGSYASTTNLPPTASFNYTTSFLTANFTDTSIDSNGSIVSRSWDFGDGTTSTATNPSKTYANAGTYPVTLTVTDNGGLSNQTTQQVTVVAPTVSLSIADMAIKEGNSGTKILTFKVTLSAASTSNVTYNIATSDGTATAGSDYVASSLTNVTIPAGSLSKNFAVTINGDTVVEPDETFFVNISNVNGALVARGQAIGTIQNDDFTNSPPTANFTYTTNALTANFTDTSSDSDGSIASRHWDFGDGTTSTATNPSKTYANAGTYPVTLTVTDNGGLSGQATQQVSVAAPPPVNLSIADASITEGNSGTKTLTFLISLSAASASNVTFNIATADGTATAGSDYVASSLTNQTIAAGSLSKNFAVTINGDTVVEPDETFFVNISNVSGALVARGQAVGTIQNDDVANIAPTASFTYTTNALTANFTDTSSDSDGSIASRHWDFGDGTTSTATNPSKTYANAGTYPVTLTVTDNGGLSSQATQQVSVVAPPPTVSLSIADMATMEGNSGTKTLVFKVALSAASSSNVTYNIATADGTATAGSDYVASSLTNQTIAAGSLSKNFAVTINGDTTVEPDETFFVNLSNVNGALVARGQAVGTIQNDDCVCLSIGNVSVTEGNSGTKLATFTISLSSASTSNVTYDIATANGTAIAGSDYVAASLTGQTIPAGQLSNTFSVVINGDTTVETNERFKVIVSNVSGATLSNGVAFGTIVNDD